MSGRVSRQRAPVDYNDKNSTMIPAWLKGIQSSKSQTPPKKASKITVSSPGSAEKENGVVEKKAAKPKPPKSSKGPEKETVAGAAEKKPKQKKSSTIGEKAAAQPARGRNAGLTVVPIGEFDR